MSLSEVYEFHLAFRREMESLAPVELCYPGEEGAVGDGLSALRAAVVAAGRDEVSRVLSRAGGRVEVNACVELAFQLTEISQIVYEEKGGVWPQDDPQIWKIIGEFQTVTASLGPLPLPKNDFVKRVCDLLTAWEASQTYRQAVLDKGVSAFWCSGTVYSPSTPWGARGTRWRSVERPDVIEVAFNLDLTDFPVLGAHEGEMYLRGLIDKIAKRRKLPDARATLGLPERN